MGLARFLFALAFLASTTRPAAAGDPGDPSTTSAAARWGAEYFPNVPLVSHEGRTLRFFDDLIHDKVVVLSFIYTRCPDACPLETAKLSEVASLLGERVGRDVFFYSISIDPEHDTPEVLREYSQRFQTPPGWLFLTGLPDDVRLLRERLGMIRADESALADHTLSLLIGNQATGKWLKRSPMDNPYFLATQIGSWLSDWKLPPEPGLEYEHAPVLRDLSRGENLFRTRCSACHLVGAEDGIPRQGPNLLGVTERRERAWLARWLAEPDAMLAERDPLAVELFEAYRKLPMPNMRLGEVEVEAVLAYLEDESAWYARSDDESEGSEASEAPDLVGEPPACCQKELTVLVGDEEAPSASAASEPLVFEPLSAPSPSAPASRVAPWPRGALGACGVLVLALGALATCVTDRRAGRSSHDDPRRAPAARGAGR
jgi:cytochrome oxidase Cu insertion factor (SCO1/SenC/PrrC family)/mono/diheme cytochrome c family protein